MRKYILFMAFILIIAGGALLLFKFFSARDMGIKQPRVPGIAARVNGINITRKALMEAVAEKIPPGEFHTGILKEDIDRIAKETLEGLIIKELEYQDAISRQLTPDQEEVEKRLELMRKGFSTQEEFKKALEREKLSLDDLRKRVERDLLIDQIEKLMTHEKVEITEEFLKTYYEGHKDRFVSPEQVKLRQILLKVAPGAQEREWEKTKQKAQDILKRIEKGGDFARLAKELSDDETSKDKGGDLGYVQKNRLFPELEKSVSSLKKGGVSTPIRTPHGYHLILLEDQKPSSHLSYDEIDKEQLRKELDATIRRRRWKKWVDELREKAKIEIIDYNLSASVPLPIDKK